MAAWPALSVQGDIIHQGKLSKEDLGSITPKCCALGFFPEDKCHLSVQISEKKFLVAFVAIVF